ncbi:hypothetical protein FisN_4Hh565 [Fistulifera solaris]|uniref:Calcineurin-like phosphoesterase domain-containing protein n=1 Tax=Fistulifera solaris TaxID=1519565 RepID=A0A1Z5K5S0_FISSO|nr:hypothetical protein FisN_4Hh565 [Fistulifera solaris]|eukprot:GAX21502.1 hypothetical protein FisN_4Hh565 [Fistulifera solaris]
MFASQPFRVGDLVVTKIEGSDNVSGVVKEVRGSGWYEVELDNDKRVLKCRGSSLLRRTDPPALTLENASRIELQEVYVADTPLWDVPPPTTIFDLDAAVQQLQSDPPLHQRDLEYLKHVSHHMSYKKWVVFTDLHCYSETLNTTLKVLDHVHELAIERNAGVLFLGDWWHHRGTLRVDCLNAVLSSLKNWTVPMVMIPGNHDQVTLGGHIHGLTALENSYQVRDKTGSGKTYPGPLVFSYPTKFLDALFIPHVRDNAIMESLLQSSLSKSADALFVHADTSGAYMNDLIVSRDGISISLFPPDKPIYSGHFHKPHVVKSKRNRLEYLGSPYQVSLSEAHQQKALIVVDAADKWNCIERIPIDIGRKHFRVNSIDDFLRLRPSNETSADGAVIHPGDRVVLTLNRQTYAKAKLTKNGEENKQLELQAQALRSHGVVVEIREVKESTSGTITPLATPEEDLDPASLWNKYLDQSLKEGSVSQDLSEELKEQGLKLLESLADDVTSIGFRSQTKLLFESVSVEGFGPFQQKVEYPLKDRGLILLRGVNEDAGSDSNGSGKTSLAVSILWALTGTTDPRPSQDYKVSDVVNDSSKSSRVIVNGELNGVKFAISRMKTLSRGGLTFMFGGDDLTAQSVQETQKVINEKLGISAELLSRTLFHGQHSLNGLLESTDTKLKDELSLIVPLDIWQKAASLARKQSSAASKVEAQLDGMISVRSADLDNARGKLNFTSEQMENARLRKDASLATLKEFAVALSSESEKVTQTKSLDSLNSELFSCEAFILELEKELSSAKVLLDQDLATCEGEIKTLESSLADLEALERNVYHEQQVILGHLEVAKERLARLETMWKVDLSHGVPKNFRLPKECPTCSQAINDVNHSHQDENLQLSVVESMTLAFMEHEKTIRQAEERTEEVQTTRDRTNSMRKEVGQMIQDRDKRARKWTIEIGEIESNLHRERNRQRELSKQLSELASSIDRDLQKASLEAALQEASEKVRYLEMTVDSVREQVTKLEETLFELNIQRDQHSRSSVVMSELSQLFSPKGIQSFILKNTIADLETATQSFLTEISDGTQQLHLSLESGEGISRRAFTVPVVPTSGASCVNSYGSLNQDWKVPLSVCHSKRS